MIYNKALKHHQSSRLNENNSQPQYKPVERIQSDNMNEEPLRDRNKAEKLPQVIAGFVATFGGFIVGSVLGWYGSVNVQLRERYDDVNEDMIPWIASILYLGIFVATIVPVVVLDRLGRKKTMMCLLPAIIVGWLVLALSSNGIACVLGRFLTGLGCGPISVAAPVYIGEIAQKDIRSTLGVSFHLQMLMGYLYTSTLGFSDSITIVSLACCIPVIVFVFLLKFIPESPIFLLCKGNNEAAAKSLQWLRGNRYNITEELNEMSTLVEESNMRGKSFNAMWKHRAAFCGLVISNLLMISKQLSGINTVKVYSMKLYQFAGHFVTPQITLLLLTILQIIAELVITLTVRWIRHQILLVASQTCMGIALLLMGIYFFIRERDKEYANLVFWLPHCSVAVFLTSYSMGVGPLPWLMVGELFPIEAKAICSSISVGVNWFMAFIVSYTFPMLIQQFHISAVIWIYAEFCLLDSVLIFLFVIETNNKTLEDIQKELVEDLEKEQ